MSRILRIAVLSTLLAASATPSFAAEPGTTSEHFRYSWRLRGGLAWIAGIRFPVSGIGLLKNALTPNGSVQSELVITGSGNREGKYIYRSEIDRDLVRTLVSSNGYQWDGRVRNEQTRFDYGNGLARTRKERENRPVETKVRKLQASDMRDVLTGIHYLRHHADAMSAPVASEIYSDGSVYPVVFRPLGGSRVSVDGKQVAARGFEITAAPGDRKKWPGGVKVWLSADEQKIPLRIEIQQGSLASLHLELVNGNS